MLINILCEGADFLPFQKFAYLFLKMFDRFLTIRLYKKGEIRYKLQNLYYLTVESVLHLGWTGADLAFSRRNKLLKRFHRIDIEQKTVLFWARYQIF